MCLTSSDKITNIGVNAVGTVKLRSQTVPSHELSQQLRSPQQDLGQEHNAQYLRGLFHGHLNFNLLFRTSRIREHIPSRTALEAHSHFITPLQSSPACHSPTAEGDT